MNTSYDEPVENLAVIDVLEPLPECVTHAVVVDGFEGETVITDFMIRRACDQIDEQQQYPFCAIGGLQKRRAG